MRVRIDIGLDFDGLHTFDWEPSNAPSAVEISKATLERWSAEREAFNGALRRYKGIIDEVEEALYRTEQSRARLQEPALARAAPRTQRSQ